MPLGLACQMCGRQAGLKVSVAGVAHAIISLLQFRGSDDCYILLQHISLLHSAFHLAMQLALHCPTLVCSASDLCVGDGCNKGWQAQTRRCRTQAQAVQRGSGKRLFPATRLHQHHHSGCRHMAVRSSGYSRTRLAAFGVQLCGVRLSNSLHLVLQLGKHPLRKLQC